MRETLKKYHGTLIGLTFIVVWTIIYVSFYYLDLWGEPSKAGPSGFCEYFDPARLVGETMNSWSNTVYMGVGMLVLVYYDLLRMGKVKRKDTYIDRDENQHYYLVYGLLVVWLGVGSFLMHGLRRGETGFLDVFSMNMFLSGVFLVSLAFLFDMKKLYFYILFIIDFILIIYIMRSGFNFPSFGGGGLFEFLVALTVISESLLSIGVYSKIFKRVGARNIKRNTVYLALSLGTFLFAYFLWHFGRRDMPTCDPYSWWQWHAIWHMITAGSTLIIALYIRTEREIKLIER